MYRPRVLPWPVLAVGNILALPVTAARADVIVPTLATSQNLFTVTGVGARVANLTNNSRLSSPLPNGTSLAFAQTVTHVFDPSGELQSWVTTSVEPNYFASRPNPVFVWDLGQDSFVNDIALRQSGNNGVNRNGSFGGQGDRLGLGDVPEFGVRGDLRRGAPV